VLAGAAEQGVVRSEVASQAGRPAETSSEDLEENAVVEINSGNVQSL
jgi:hypothetical protein